jgi:hypothetical protein
MGQTPAPGSAGPRSAPDQIVPGGQVIPVRGEDASGEIYVLSDARTAAGARFTIVARTRGQSGLVGPPEPRRPGPVTQPARHTPAGLLPFSQFTATDHNGTSYRMSTHPSTRDPRGCTLRPHPDPPHDLRWLDLTTTPGEPAVRIDLTRPSGTARVTVSKATLSPGEHLRNNIAMRLLAVAATRSAPFPASSPC